MGWSKFLFIIIFLTGNAFAENIETIAFGSCASQNKEQGFWSDILNEEPDLFIFGGDNIYGDTEDMDVLRAKYRLLGSKPEFIEFRSQVPMLAVWDDHDYGVNDGGKDYRMRAQSQQVFLDFFYPDASEALRNQEGIYQSRVYDSAQGRIQIILLDTRYHRSALKKKPKKKKGSGPYVPLKDPRSTMLGSAQWKWLEKQLQEPADLRLIVTSIQFLNKANGWEAWSTLPLERNRLIKLINKYQVENIVMLSGDRHFGEISKFQERGTPVFYDFTSSGLTHGSTYGSFETNPLRIGETSDSNNYGLIKINWSERRVKLILKDKIKGIAASHEFKLK